jgi:DNA-directed RNA polymerase specialized sigma24 family protein
MPADSNHHAALSAVRTAQKRFERESSATNQARRKAFAQAQKEGLTLRQIGEAVGLHHTRVGEIIRGDGGLGDVAERVRDFATEFIA